MSYNRENVLYVKILGFNSVKKVAMETSPQISKSPFKAKNYLNLKPLSEFNQNLLPSNKLILRRLLKIQENSKRNTSIKLIAEQIYDEVSTIYRNNEIEMKTKINSINKIIKLHQDWFKYSKCVKKKKKKLCGNLISRLSFFMNT